MTMSKPFRRYNMRVVWLSLLYSVFLIGAVYGFKHQLAAAALRPMSLAILPALPIIGIFAAIGRYLVEEQDEYVRMLMVRQTLVGERFRAQRRDRLGLSRKLRPRRPRRRLLHRRPLVRRPRPRRVHQPADARRAGALLMENRLKVLRADAQLEPKDLAEKLEVSRQSVNAIETGTIRPVAAARLPHRRTVRAADRGDFRLAERGTARRRSSRRARPAQRLVDDRFGPQEQLGIDDHARGVRHSRSPARAARRR